MEGAPSGAALAAMMARRAVFEERERDGASTRSSYTAVDEASTMQAKQEGPAASKDTIESD